jgi:hypothetical protein
VRAFIVRSMRAAFIAAGISTEIPAKSRSIAGSHSSQNRAARSSSSSHARSTEGMPTASRRAIAARSIATSRHGSSDSASCANTFTASSGYRATSVARSESVVPSITSANVGACRAGSPSDSGEGSASRRRPTAVASVRKTTARSCSRSSSMAR